MAESSDPKEQDTQFSKDVFGNILNYRLQQWSHPHIPSEQI